MTIAPATESPGLAETSPTGPLPSAASVLVVTARPGPESEDLGGLLYAFRKAGASLSLLCLTRGEGATRNAAAARLEAIRPWELQLACSVLGVFELTVASYPDGRLHRQPVAELTDRISRAIRQHSPDLLLIVAPEDGGLDDIAVAVAARAAGARSGVPVAGRTRPGAMGAWVIDLGADASTARAIQKAAAAAHTSQSEGLADLLHRLDLLDDTEALRWVLSPRPVPPPRPERIPAGVVPLPRSRPAKPADFGG